MKVREAHAKHSRENPLDHDVDSLLRANLATFRTTTRSELIVKAKSVEEVVSVVEFANSKRLKLYTISQGKNWGFGSKVPVEDASILLDLSQMNNIISYDKKFGTVRVEPGVTFLQLSSFLKQEGDSHFLNTIGGDPEASVLGNILERGDGVGPYCERSAHACCSEIVLANGTVFETGFGNIENSRLSNLSKEGLGPGFQELFYQSNLGIVTKITVWLQPKPKHFRMFSFAQDESHSFSQMLETVRQLYLKRILDTPITFWNDYKLLSASFQLSNFQSDARPLQRATVKRNSNDYRTWHGFAGIYVDHPKISKQILKEIFQQLRPHIKKKTFWSDLSPSKIRLLRMFNNFLGLRQFSFNHLLMDWSQCHLLGHVSKKSIRSLFWRKTKAIPETIDPNLQLCGVLWNSFMIPFDGDLIEEVLNRLNEIILNKGFEPMISFITLNDRYIKVFQQLIFDREDEEQDRVALQCHQEVFEYLEKTGCTHSRLDILNMERGRQMLKNNAIHKELKNALDPERIFSSGRYFG